MEGLLTTNINILFSTAPVVKIFNKRTCADVWFCLDCRETVGGHTYTGNVDRTKSGRTCQSWTSHSPHQHVYNLDSMYPDGSVAAAGNKCRNPASDYSEGVWCFTTDAKLRWELCDTRLCFGECILPLSNTWNN